MSAKKQVLALYPQACVTRHGMTEHKWYGVITRPRRPMGSNTFLSAHCASPRQAWTEALAHIFDKALTT